jgi:hypothetical protein
MLPRLSSITASTVEKSTKKDTRAQAKKERRIDRRRCNIITEVSCRDIAHEVSDQDTCCDEDGRHVCTVAARRCGHSPHWPIPLPAKELQLQGSTSRRHTLVLDVDHTLLAFCDRWDHEDSRLETRRVILRPHVGEFMREMHELFEVVLWTASPASHAAAMAVLLERAAGLPPSTYYDATVPWGCFDPMPSLSRADALRTRHTLVKGDANWYLLSAGQIIDSMEKLKYLPITGRDPDSVIMIDDSVRSFTLTPRSGIKISAFYGNAGDAALLELLPLLRAVAAAESAVGELDHWRPDEYIECDDFKSNMNYTTNTRSCILGSVLPHRRSSGRIPAPVSAVGNEALIQRATTHMQALWEQSKSEKLRSLHKGEATGYC